MHLQLRQSDEKRWNGGLVRLRVSSRSVRRPGRASISQVDISERVTRYNRRGVGRPYLGLTTLPATHEECCVSPAAEISQCWVAYAPVRSRIGVSAEGAWGFFQPLVLNYSSAGQLGCFGPIMGVPGTRHSGTRAGRHERGQVHLGKGALR